MHIFDLSENQQEQWESERQCLIQLQHEKEQAVQWEREREIGDVCIFLSHLHISLPRPEEIETVRHLFSSLGWGLQPNRGDPEDGETPVTASGIAVLAAVVRRLVLLQQRERVLWPSSVSASTNIDSVARSRMTTEHQRRRIVQAGEGGGKRGEEMYERQPSILTHRPLFTRRADQFCADEIS